MDFKPQRYCTQWSWVVFSSGAVATNAAVRSVYGDSFVDGSSKSFSLAIGDSTTSKSLVPISMAPTNAEGSKPARLAQGVPAYVGDESAVVDSVSDDESSVLNVTLGKRRNLGGLGGVGGVLTQRRPTLSAASEVRNTFAPPAFDGGQVKVT